MSMHSPHSNLSIQREITLPQSAEPPIGAICGDRESFEAVREAGGGFSGICFQIATVWCHLSLNWMVP